MTNHIRIDCAVCAGECVFGRDDDLYIIIYMWMCASAFGLFSFLFDAIRFYCPNQRYDIITSSHEHTRTASTIAIVPSTTIYCLYWIQKRCIALRFIALIVDSIWWIYCISKQNKTKRARTNNNNGKHTQWKQSTTEPFYWLMFKAKNHKNAKKRKEREKEKRSTEKIGMGK